MNALIAFDRVVAGIGTGQSHHGFVAVAIQRLPTDPLFFADIEIQNAVVGSRYRVARQSDDLELATGTVPTSTFQLTSIPVYSNPMLVEIRIRNASGSPAYRPYLGFLSMQNGLNIAFVSQELDE